MRLSNELMRAFLPPMPYSEHQNLAGFNPVIDEVGDPVDLEAIAPRLAVFQQAVGARPSFNAGLGENQLRGEGLCRSDAQRA